jgi:acyl-CoA dehydrogenase
VREIEKMGRNAVDSNSSSSTGSRVPVEDRIGEEGKGFRYILHGMNPERILIAAEAVGIGRAALRKRDRLRQGARVFDRADRPEPGHPASARALLGELEAPT